MVNLSKLWEPIVKYKSKTYYVDAVQWGEGVDHPLVQKVFVRADGTPPPPCPACGRDAKEHGGIQKEGKNVLVCPGSWIVVEAESGGVICMSNEAFKNSFIEANDEDLVTISHIDMYKRACAIAEKHTKCECSNITAVLAIAAWRFLQGCAEFKSEDGGTDLNHETDGVVSFLLGKMCINGSAIEDVPEKMHESLRKAVEELEEIAVRFRESEDDRVIN